MQISAILALAATANWAAFDGTRTGIILGALLAVGAPLSESVIVNVLGWWHYDRPDYLGVVLWAGTLQLWPLDYAHYYHYACFCPQG